MIVGTDLVAADRDKRQERERERPGIDQGAVAADHSPCLELPDPLHDRGRRQTHVPGDFGLGLAGVGLKNLEDSQVERVDVSVNCHINELDAVSRRIVASNILLDSGDSDVYSDCCRFSRRAAAANCGLIDGTNPALFRV